jgi:hypothetical protein
MLFESFMEMLTDRNERHIQCVISVSLMLAGRRPSCNRREIRLSCGTFFRMSSFLTSLRYFFASENSNFIASDEVWRRLWYFSAFLMMEIASESFFC